MGKLFSFLRNISSVLADVSKAFFQERRKRARIKRDKLIGQLAELEKMKPTKRIANKYYKLEKKLRNVERYLEED